MIKDDSLAIKKLDTIIRLLAIGVARDKSLKEQVALLGSAGLTPTEIAEVLNKTPNLIRVTQHGLRHGKKGRDKDEAKDE